MRTPLMFLAAAACCVPTLTGCGDDPTGYEIWAQPVETTLPADGSRSTRVLISVLRGDLTPVPVGSEVVVLCVNSASQPAGIFQGGDEGVTSIFLDATGQGEVVVACNGDPTVEDFLLCVVRYDDEQVRAESPIACEPAATP